MKTIYKQSLLIFFLIVMIFIITNLISIGIKKKQNKIISLSKRLSYKE